jgi:hypothetical protein
MQSSATIYSPRISLKRSIPYVIAGIGVLLGGAFLGKYVGQQAAARSVAEADWAPQSVRLVSMVRGTTLLRGSVIEQDSAIDIADKDQDRIPGVRPVVGENRGDRRRKTDFLASLVPTGPVEDLLGARAKALPVRLAMVSRSGTAEMPDEPMFGNAVPLPGEIIQDGVSGLGGASPEAYDDSAGTMEGSVGAPSAAKLAAIMRRGDAAKAKLAAYLKHQRAEQTCLAKAIYFEARSEPTLGQIAVAGVVMNRVESKKYPDTICGVVFQNDHMKNACQFSFACDGKADVARSRKHWRSALQLAKAFMDGTKKAHVIRNAMYYHADYVSPDWATRMHVVKKIGRHIFYVPVTRVASR